MRETARGASDSGVVSVTVKATHRSQTYNHKTASRRQSTVARPVRQEGGEKENPNRTTQQLARADLEFWAACGKIFDPWPARAAIVS